MFMLVAMKMFLVSNYNCIRFNVIVEINTYNYAQLRQYFHDIYV